MSEAIARNFFRFTHFNRSKKFQQQNWNEKNLVNSWDFHFLVFWAMAKTMNRENVSSLKSKYKLNFYWVCALREDFEMNKKSSYLQTKTSYKEKFFSNFVNWIFYQLHWKAFAQTFVFESQNYFWHLLVNSKVLTSSSIHFLPSDELPTTFRKATKLSFLKNDEPCKWRKRFEISK